MATPQEAEKDLLIAWLNDAHAMENVLIPVLENHAKDSKDHPTVQARIERHIQETRRHAEMVKSCVQRLGTATSAIKTGLGKAFGMFHSVSTGAFRDEMVKNCISDFAAENFEIACYRSLIEASEELGSHDVAQVCREILRDEEDMARFLLDQIPAATRAALLVKAGVT